MPWLARYHIAKEQQSFAVVARQVAANGVTLAAAERVGREGSSLRRLGSLARRDWSAVRKVRTGWAEGGRMHPDAVRGPLLAAQTGPRREPPRSCSEGSHHGSAPPRVCTRTADSGHEAAAARHGGCMGSRHRTPRCWTRRTASVSTRRVGACWIGVGVTTRVAVIPLAPPRLGERSAASWAPAAPPSCVAAMWAAASARPSPTAQCRLLLLPRTAPRPG